MDPFSVVVGVLTLIKATQKAADYLLAVKNAPKETARLVEELNDLRSVLERYESLSKRLREAPDAAQTSTLRWLADLETESSLLARSSGELEMLIARLEEKGWGPEGSKRRAATIGWKWPFTQQETISSLERIERLRQKLADGLNLSLDTHEEVVGMSRRLSSLEEEKLRDRVYNWLAAPNPLRSHEEARAKCLLGTGEWFIEHMQYHKWRVEPNSLLWLHGTAGCGKTVLSSITIEDLSKQCQAHSSNALAYFYFETSGGSEKHDIAALRSLLAQFSKQSEDGMTKLKDLYHSCDTGRHQATHNELLSCLKTMVQSFTATYILLDALDECKNRPELLRLIPKVNRWQLANLHVLVTSRREADIREVLEMLAQHEKIIELDPSSNNSDINFYIQDRLSNDLGLKRWRKRPDIQARIKEQLLRKGDGMFRWVVWQLDILQDCVNLPMLGKALGSLPSTIGETYELMLSGIKDQFKPSSIKAFQWLALSVRPLNVDEFVDVLAIDVHTESKFDPDWRMPDANDILRVCTSLIAINCDHKNERKPRFVKLAHFSVEEYLLSDTVRAGRASEYAVSYSQGHAAIAEACLHYLLIMFPVDVAETIGPEAYTLYPLGYYAKDFWWEYIHRAGEQAKPLFPLISKLLQRKGHEWVQ
ncbi:MAG: hypothetical protein Q9221_003072 [Calogaya cf. arnoldii]